MGKMLNVIPNTVMSIGSNNSFINNINNNNNDVALTRADMDKIIVENYDYLTHFIRKKVWDKQEVNEIVQTVVLEALKGYQNFKGNSSPKTWLCGIAINIIRSYAKEHVSKKTTSIDDVEEDSFDSCMHNSKHGDPFYSYQHSVCFARVEEVFNEFPEDMKETYDLVINNGKSYQCTADILNIPVGTVRSRISRARETMRMTISH